MQKLSILILSAALGTSVLGPMTDARAASVRPRAALDKPVTFHLKNADLREFFGELHRKTGWNVVLSPSVGGRLSLDVENAPIGSLLDAVAKTNGLAFEDDGIVLAVETFNDHRRRLAEERADGTSGELSATPATRTLSAPEKPASPSTERSARPAPSPARSGSGS